MRKGKKKAHDVFLWLEVMSFIAAILSTIFDIIRFVKE